MLLHWSPKSPFVRKVCVVLHEKNRSQDLDYVRSVALFTARPNPQILKDNPLGKIPVLVTDDHHKLFDSRVICEYLNEQFEGADLFHQCTPHKYQQLTWQALGDGLIDILLLWRIERKRQNHADATILKSFEEKTIATFTQLETDAKALKDHPFGIGHIAIICALDQFNFRFQGSNWQQAHPNLFEFYENTSKRPSFVNTKVISDDPLDQEHSDSPFTFRTMF